MPKKLEDLDRQLAASYMTAQEAQKELGVDRDRFNYLVRTEAIKRHQLLGKHGLYKRNEIRALATRINAFLIAGRTSDLDFRRATEDDLDAEVELTALCFGTKRAQATVEARKRFLAANPQAFWHLYSYQNLVAAINIVPLVHEAIEEFRDGKRGWLFPSEQIEQFEQGHRLECIIIDMMTTPRIPPEERRRYGAYLLLDLMHTTFVSFGMRGVDIKSVDACAGTHDGERMLRGAGFEYLGNRNGREIFHLDLDTSELPLLRPYKDALRAWRQKQP
jgi:hypothetical protein